MTTTVTITVDSQDGADTSLLFPGLYASIGFEASAKDGVYTMPYGIVVQPNPSKPNEFGTGGILFLQVTGKDLTIPADKRDLGGYVSSMKVLISSDTGTTTLARLDVTLDPSLAANGGLRVPSLIGLTPSGLLSQGVSIGAGAQAPILNVYGAGGDDRLVGSGWSDFLDGRSGADTMIGGGGSDTYFVDDGGDRVIETSDFLSFFENDLVKSSVSYALPNNVEYLTLTGTGKIDGFGNSLNNRLIGNRADNVLDGRGGADTMEGGKGNDFYRADNAGDRVIEAVKGGSDTVVANVSYRLATGQEIETLRLTKSAAKDLKITGNEFANTLVGNDDGNTLNGAGGADILTGRGGKDTFHFTTKPGGSGPIDHITDFSQADDTISLARSVFTALKAGALSGMAFKDLAVKGAKVDADDRLLYDHDTGVLRYDSDGSGKAAAATVAVLDNHARLDHTDFFIL